MKGKLGKTKIEFMTWYTIGQYLGYISILPIFRVEGTCQENRLRGKIRT